MSKLSFLDSPQGEDQATAPVVAPEPVPEPVAAEPAPQASAPVPPVESAGQERGPDGKFLPKATASEPPAVAAEPPTPAAPEPAPIAAAPAAAPEPPPLDPVVAELQKQVAGLTKALTATRQERRAPAEPAPDPREDIEAYQQWQETQRASERANWSRQLAEAKTDPETVAKAHEWAAARADADPVFAHRAWTHPDPYGFALEEYEQHQTLQMLRDPKLREQFHALINGQAAPSAAPAPAAPAPAPVAAAPPPPAAEPPPPSLASAPSAGGPASTPQGPGRAYDRLFHKG